MHRRLPVYAFQRWQYCTRSNRRGNHGREAVVRDKRREEQLREFITQDIPHVRQEQSEGSEGGDRGNKARTLAKAPSRCCSPASSGLGFASRLSPHLFRLLHPFRLKSALSPSSSSSQLSTSPRSSISQVALAPTATLSARLAWQSRLARVKTASTTTIFTLTRDGSPRATMLSTHLEVKPRDGASTSPIPLPRLPPISSLLAGIGESVRAARLRAVLSVALEAVCCSAPE